MIPFLTKLANLLDDRGQYAMAREVDDLILKLAQQTSFMQDWLNAHKKLNGLLRRMKEVVTDQDALKKINDYQGSIDALLSRAGRNQISAKEVDWSSAAWEEFKGVLRSVYNQIPENTGIRTELRDLDLKINQADSVKAELPKAREVLDPSNNKELAELFDKQNPNLAKQPTEMASKAPAKHKPNKQTADLIRLIQNAIGTPVDGKWGQETNKAFIAYMNKNLPLAMNNNQFVGLVTDDKGTRSGNKLSDAWQLIKEQEGAKTELAQEQAGRPQEQDMASKAPAKAPATTAPVAWKSKHFQITPEVQKSLQQIEKNWPGTAQQEINKLDQQKEGKGVGQHMDQETFEEMLSGRSKPA